MSRKLALGLALGLLSIVALCIVVSWLAISLVGPALGFSGASRVIANSRTFLTNMAMAPDGQTLALGTLNSGAQLWSVADSKMLYALNKGRVDGIAYSPDGATLAFFWKSADEKQHQVELHSSADGQLIKTLATDATFVYSLAFSPDGSLLALGESGRTRLCSVTTGACNRILSAPGWTVAFSPDGTMLAAGGANITVWRVADGSQQRSFAGWYHVLFAPDGSTLASAADVNGATVELHRTADWSRQTTLAKSGGTGNSQIHSLAFSRDGTMLAFGASDFTAEVWDVKSGANLKTMQLGTNNDPNGVAFSPDGKTLVVQTNYEVQFWPTGK